MTERTISALNYELQCQRERLLQETDKLESYKWSVSYAEKQIHEIKQTIQELEAIIINLDKVTLVS